MTTEPINHVRRADLPWRTAILTECGRPVADLSTISRAEFASRVKAQGQHRSALTTCMTCWDTARRWPEWAADPVAALGREVAGAGHFSDGRHDQIRRELRALAALVEEHRDEFDGFLADLANTVSLAERRAMRRREVLGGGRGV